MCCFENSSKSLSYVSDPLSRRGLCRSLFTTTFDTHVFLWGVQRWLMELHLSGASIAGGICQALGVVGVF